MERWQVILAVIVVYLAVTLGIGLAAGRRSSKSVAGFVAGDREFGLLVMYFVTGASVFSAFAFLGGPGWAYSRGAAAFYILSYGALGMAPWYWIGPRVAQVGRRMGYVTQAQLLVGRFPSRFLSVLVATLTVVAFVPYITLQRSGAGIVIEAVTDGHVSFAVGAAVAYGIVIIYVLSSGVVAVGKHTGHHRVPHAKGQAIPAWDPRPLKATGVTYATSPMGADHTAGLIVNPGMQPDEFARASQEAQLVNAVCDSSGFCQFLQPNLDDIRSFYGHLYGIEISRDEIADQGWQCLQDEWEFNRRAGFSEADDDLPACMKEDPIGPMKLVYDVDKAIVEAAKQKMDYREEMFAAKATG